MLDTISVFKEKDEFFNKIGLLHEEYYKKALSLCNAQEAFMDSLYKEKFPGSANTRVERVLETRPSSHFGDAFKRLQSLFFMLRDNEDVF